MSWVRVLSCIFLTIISCFFWGGMKGQANMSFLMFLLHWPKDTNMKPQRNVTPPPEKKRQEWFLIWTSHPFLRVPTSINRNEQVFFLSFFHYIHLPKKSHHPGFSSPSGWLVERSPFYPFATRWAWPSRTCWAFLSESPETDHLPWSSVQRCVV